MASQVYFIRSADGLIKIGTSTNVGVRIRALQTAHGAAVELLGVIPGDQDIERQFHKRWADLRAQGEWFRPSAEMERAIQDEISRPRLPLAAPRRKQDPEKAAAMDRLIAFLRSVHPLSTAEHVSQDIGIAADTVRRWLERVCLPSFDGATAMVFVYGPKFLAATQPPDQVPAWVHEAVAFEEAELLVERIRSDMAALDTALATAERVGPSAKVAADASAAIRAKLPQFPHPQEPRL